MLSITLHLAWSIPQAPLGGGQQGATFLPANVPGDTQPSGAAQGCGTCLLVADVAGLVWYSQVFINPQTELVGIGVNNASRTTRTSLLQNEGAFTYNPGSNAQATGLTQINFAPSVTVSGAVLYV